MSHPILFSSAVPPIPNLISRLPLRRGFPVVLFALALVCFALSPTARALSPPPDGGYSNKNTAEGGGALSNLTTGGANTAIGFHTLFNDRTGGGNTATGYSALYSNTNGGANTANGDFALYNNISGSYNTANGYSALYKNIDGNANTANGYLALFSSTTGNNNTANGVGALSSNTAGNSNTATGVSALLKNTTGIDNTAEGAGALGNNTGSFNVALGFNAGASLTTGSNNIDIGHGGVAGESNTMRIGTGKQTATFITGIRGTATANANAVPVVIDSAGQLGTVSSSRRFKDEIKPMDNSSEAILRLKPVTFHYKSDTRNTPQFGLIAEEVAKVNPDLVVRDENGEIYTVRYEAVNAMLLNEFLKEHRRATEQQAKVAKQESTITELKTTVAQQQKQIEALTAGLQKVSAAVELPLQRVAYPEIAATRAYALQ